MSYIKCKSFIQDKDVNYNLIGVKLKHRVLNQDYGTSTLNYPNVYFNTSPGQQPNTVITNLNPFTLESRPIYGTSGKLSQNYSASGVLECTYDNSNTGKNPLITGRTFHIDELDYGFNYFDCFETDTVKIVTVILKIKKSVAWPTLVSLRNTDGTYITEDIDMIQSVYLNYVLKSNGITIGSYNLMSGSVNEFSPITFSVNSELFWIKDFNPKYKSTFSYSSSYSMWLTTAQSENNGLYIEGSKSIAAGNFVGIAHSMLASEYWWAPRNTSNVWDKYEIVKDDELVSDTNLRAMNSSADILYFRNRIENEPNQFIKLTMGSASTGEIAVTDSDRLTWANTNINTGDYKLKAYGALNSTIFNTESYIGSSIIMPCVNPTTYEPVGYAVEGMFISLTQDIYEGTAPDPEPEPEPPKPETTEPAENPETEYELTPWTNEKEYEYPVNEIISGVGTDLYLFKPSYSNFIFKGYYKNEDTDPDMDYAHQFIQDACNPSSFELFGAFFKLVSGHPTPGEIIARIYQLPFTAEDIVTYMQGGITVLSAPVYGAVGPITMGAKTYMEDPTKTGEPDPTNIHYYRKIVNKFGTLDLGTVNISRVFNNYLDYTETRYTLNLPYGGGQVDLDPDLLFPNNRISPAAVKLIGILDFDTGELTIKIQINSQFYHETVINVASDRIGVVEDKTAIPIAIGKTITGIAAIAGGLGRALGPRNKSADHYKFEEFKTKEIIKRQQSETEEIAKRIKASTEEAKSRTDYQLEKVKAATDYKKAGGEI